MVRGLIGDPVLQTEDCKYSRSEAEHAIYRGSPRGSSSRFLKHESTVFLPARSKAPTTKLGFSRGRRRRAHLLTTRLGFPVGRKSRAHLPNAKFGFSRGRRRRANLPTTMLVFSRGRKSRALQWENAMHLA